MSKIGKSALRGTPRWRGKAEKEFGGEKPWVECRLDYLGEKFLHELKVANQPNVQWSSIERTKSGLIEVWIYGTGDLTKVKEVARKVFGPTVVVQTN